MRVYEALDKTQTILRDPEHWGKGAFAWDADGDEVEETSPTAVCFCTIGALNLAVAGEADVYMAAKATLKSVLPSCFETVAEFNDDPTTTHADIMAMFDKAKELLACQ